MSRIEGLQDLFRPEGGNRRPGCFGECLSRLLHHPDHARREIVGCPLGHEPPVAPVDHQPGNLADSRRDDRQPVPLELLGERRLACEPRQMHAVQIDDDEPVLVGPRRLVNIARMPADGLFAPRSHDSPSFEARWRFVPFTRQNAVAAGFGLNNLLAGPV